MLLAQRLVRHHTIAAALSGIGDVELAAWIGASEPLRRAGHAALTLPGDGTPLFVKLLSLTDLERTPHHRTSTANCFDLPPSYGYRIGSAGFGVWRELATHAIANEWVMAGVRTQFPLLHGHCVVPVARPAFHAPRWPTPWGDNPAVAARQAAIEQSSHCVAVFLEPFRSNLLQWMRNRGAGTPGARDDVLRLEPQLLELAEFINSRGLRHMDAHFENIVCGDEQIYLADFGLAISDSFELSAAEQAFFERHRCFDSATMLTSLVHALFTRHAGEHGWPDALRSCLNAPGTPFGEMPAADRDFLIRRGPLWQAMADFYTRLRADITTDFPAVEIERLLAVGAP